MIRHPNRGAYQRRRRRQALEREGELLVAKHYAKQRMALAIRQLVNRTKAKRRHAKIQARRRRKLAEAAKR